MDVYVVMEWGDDYHGSRPVRAFANEDKAGVIVGRTTCQNEMRRDDEKAKNRNCRRSRMAR